MEKYQDLIVTLIKNHRRYPGCEGILDKIAEDVMDRAKDVINSVEDESIITKYLTKIVSAAMITVPKEYNICPDIKRKSQGIAPAEQIVFQEKQQETPAPEIDEIQLMESLESSTEQEESDNTAIYDSIKNSLEFDENNYADDFSQEDTLSEELGEDLTDFDDGELESDSQEIEPLIDTTEDNTLILEDNTSEELAAIEPVEIAAEEEEEEEEETPEVKNDTEEDVNKELVDKMINGNDSEYNDFQNISEKIDGLSVLYGEPEEEEIENMGSVFEEDTEEEEENNVASNIEEPSAAETVTEQPEDILQEELQETDPQEDLDTEDLQENLPVEEDNLLSVEDIEVSESQTFYDNSDITDYPKENEEAPENIDSRDVSDNFNPPSISCFNFTTEDTDDINDTETIETLMEYAGKNSELPTIEILRLKYCQNKSISQISSELNLPKEDVLNVIEALIDAVEG